MNINIKALLKIIVVDLIVIIILKLCLVFLWPFLVAILIALLMEPFIKKIVSLKINRNIAVSLSYIFIFLVLAFLTYIFIKYIINEVNKIYIVISNKIYNDQINYVIEKITTLRNSDFNFLDKTMGTINELLKIFIVFIISIILSLDFNKISENIILSIDNKYIAAFINSFIKLTSIALIELKLVVISTILTIAGFFVLGIENALTIGIICGILDLLPVLGPALIFIPWSVLAFIDKKYFLSIGLISLYALLQIIREILQVKMVGSSLKIHPVISLFALYVGVIIFKLWGVIFGPFMIIFTKELIDIERRII
ncbi:AI-2E family transporter [Caloramator sp.]|jgi:predicted PurR-regulated permease PerM|uniref:AI-2E family transporter n=1 Tax=Caloramator sp. TaxID=1871330 RepID=UPI0025BAA2E8|nr:AI-2E family transporter [Caloramator sp.]